MDKVILSVQGRNGQLELLPDRLRISRDGFKAFILQGLKGDKEIFYSEISSVQFKQPGWTVGYIQFTFLGGLETKKGVFNASSDENTVTFSHDQARAFEIFKAELDRFIANAKRPSTSSIGSLLELEKLAELKDKGILTEEEFAQKKKEILGNNTSQEISVEHQQELEQNAQEEEERQKRTTKGCIGCLGFLILGFLLLLLIGMLANLRGYFSPLQLWGVVIISFTVPILPIILLKKWNWLLKKRLYILFFVFLFFVLVWFGSTNPKYEADIKTSEAKKAQEEAVTKQKEKQKPYTPEPGSLTAEHFRWIEPGMTYQEVTRLLGQGELMSQTNIGNFDTRAYTWKKWNGANAIITFQNGKVVSKAQYGLD